MKDLFLYSLKSEAGTELNAALLAANRRRASDVGDWKGSLAPRSALGAFHLSGWVLLPRAY